jgi:phosphate transport system permease protein
MSNQRFAGSSQLLARRRVNVAFVAVCFAATLIGIFFLVVLLKEVWTQGAGWLSLDFLNNFPSRFPEQAGLKSALFGTLWVIGLTALLSFPVGVGAAIYLEEYAPRHWITGIIQTNISNLAGVPSIVYGLLGLALFVRILAFDRSVLAGALTMSLLILPIIIITSQESLRAVPSSIREAAYAVGANRWQVIWEHVLPYAIPGILTGTILAMSRAIGEAAPMITIGALTFIAYVPEGPMDGFTVLPIQIFNWASRPQAEFQNIAAAGIIVLLIVLVSMNAAAVLLRSYYRGRVKW